MRSRPRGTSAGSFQPTRSIPCIGEIIKGEALNGQYRFPVILASFAQSDRPTLSDAKMIQERESVQRALPVRNRLLRIGCSSVAASIRLNEHIFPDEVVAAGVDPIFVATCTAMEK
jgi:hypothetical protein